MKFKVLTVLLALFLCGCVGINPNSLQKVTTEETLILKQPFTWTHDWRSWGYTNEYALLAGEYTAKLKDSEGTYYEGPGYCWQWGRIENDNKRVWSTAVFKCGIFIPKAANANIKLYHFLDRIFLPLGDDADPAAKARAKTTNSDTTDSTVSTVVNGVSGTNATALQAGVGGAIAGGIIGGIEAIKQKNMQFHIEQPPSAGLRAALTKKESN